MTRAERIAKLKAETEAAEAVVSAPEFEAAEAERREEEALQERLRVARDRKRAEDIGERLDFWHDRVDTEIVSVSISAKPHDFIVTAAGHAAYKTWQKSLDKSAMDKIQKKANPSTGEDGTRAYVVAGLLDWNGTPLDERAGVEVDSEFGKKLHDFLRSEPAIVSELFIAIHKLDGGASEERKS